MRACIFAVTRSLCARVRGLAAWLCVCRASQLSRPWREKAACSLRLGHCGGNLSDCIMKVRRETILCALAVLTALVADKGKGGGGGGFACWIDSPLINSFTQRVRRYGVSPTGTCALHPPHRLMTTLRWTQSRSAA